MLILYVAGNVQNLLRGGNKKNKADYKAGLIHLFAFCLFSNLSGNFFSNGLNSTSERVNDRLLNDFLSGKGVNGFLLSGGVVASCKSEHAGDGHKEHYFLHFFDFLKLSILGF